MPVVRPTTARSARPCWRPSAWGQFVLRQRHCRSYRVDRVGHGPPCRFGPKCSTTHCLSIRMWTLLGWPMCFCCRIPIEPESEVQVTSTPPRPAPWSSEFWLQPFKLVLGVSTICICSSRAAGGRRPATQTSKSEARLATHNLLIMISFLLYSNSICPFFLNFVL